MSKSIWRREPRWRVAILVAFAVGIGIGVWVATKPDPPRGSSGDPPRDAELVVRAPSPPDPAPTPRPEDMAIASGETLTVESASLAAGGWLAVDLIIPAPSEGTERLAVRILSGDGQRVLETWATPRGEDRQRGRIEIENDWLSPDRYIIEVKTTERTHFPLRRYVLEIR